MVGRILHLLVIDILAVGVAMRRGVKDALPVYASGALDRARSQAASPPQHGGPGIRTSGPLARLTSHSR